MKEEYKVTIQKLQSGYFYHEWRASDTGLLHSLDGPAQYRTAGPEFSKLDARFHLYGLEYSSGEWTERVQKIRNPIVRMTLADVEARLGHPVMIVP